MSREKNRKRRLELNRFARQLKANVPRSEEWFYTKFKTYWHPDDKTNTPFANFIPDLINKTYKYIIEVDGSIHNLPKQKRKDEIKTKKFSSYGYKVFRVIAYDNQSFDKALQQILLIRSDFHRASPVKIFTKEDLLVYKTKF